MRIAPWLVTNLLTLASCTAHLAAPGSSQPLSSTQGTMRVQTGQVANLRDVTTAGGPITGTAPVVSAVLGGLAASSIGGGNGRTIAAVGVSIAGSIAGDRIERAGAVRKTMEVTVRFANGESQTYEVEPDEADEALRIGNTVHVTTVNGKPRITR